MVEPKVEGHPTYTRETKVINILKATKTMKVNCEWVECNGEAHENIYIDNCLVCAPYWGEYPICPDHQAKLPQSGYCRQCKKFYALVQPEPERKGL